jgi:hypothetical protein
MLSARAADLLSMRFRTLRLALLAAIAGALLFAPVANAWVRKESNRWVWYVPNNHWVDAQSDNGIDISSATGVLFVGMGFGQTPGPITHQQAVDIAVRSRGLDKHPLRGVRFVRASRPVEQQGIVRRVYEWRAYRTDRHERARGVLTVDVMTGDATFTYGFSMYARAAPASQFRRWNSRLAFMQRHIYLQPRTPEWGT